MLFEPLSSGDGGAARVAVRAQQPVIVRPEAPPDDDDPRLRMRVWPLPPPARRQLGQLDGVGVGWGRQRRWRLRRKGGGRGAAWRVERGPERRWRRGGRHAEHGADGARPQVVDRLGLIVPPPHPPLPKRVVLGGARLRIEEAPFEITIEMDVCVLKYRYIA